MTTFLAKHFWGLSGILCLHILVLSQMGQASGKKPAFSRPTFTPIQLETLPDLPKFNTPAQMKPALSALPTQGNPAAKPLPRSKSTTAAPSVLANKTANANRQAQVPVSLSASSRSKASNRQDTTAFPSAVSDTNRQPLVQPSTGSGTAEALVSPPHYQAAYLNNPEPSYPKLSRESGEEGTVRLKVEVSDKGRPLSVIVAKSSGSARLDAAALKAVSHWQFVPAKRGQQPIQQALIVPIHFSLQNS